jgi:hypothetical protein
MLHQSLIVPLAWLMIPLALPGVLEATLVLAGTIAGCALLHHFLILRVRILWPLFGVPAPATPSAARPAVQQANENVSNCAMPNDARRG